MSHESDVEFEGKVRAMDPDTSWDAAEKQTKGKTKALQDVIFNVLRTSGPMNDTELGEKYSRLTELNERLYPKATEQSIRTRRKELVTAGRVKASGLPKRPSGNGGPSTVWMAVE